MKRACPNCLDCPLLRDLGSAEVVPPHAEARQRGAEDGRDGLRLWASAYPPGVYGHADYELGFWGGRDGGDDTSGSVSVDGAAHDRRG